MCCSFLILCEGAASWPCRAVVCFQIEEVGLLGPGEDIPLALARVLCEEALAAGGGLEGKRRSVPKWYFLDEDSVFMFSF